MLSEEVDVLCDNFYVALKDTMGLNDDFDGSVKRAIRKVIVKDGMI